MLDLILELIHHLGVFGIAAVIAAEFVLVAPGMDGRRIGRLAVLDGLYGGLAVLVVVAGFARVIWGETGWDFYVLNWVFWTKIALFVIVALISIRPTMAILRWRRAAAADPAFTAPPAEAAGLRRYFIAELVVFAMIPIAAAIMARGIGL